MKPKLNIHRNLLLCSLALSLQGVSGAATLYSQTFASTATTALHNTAVQAGTLSDTWDATAGYKLNGTTGNVNGSAVLDFIPAPNMIYSVTATVSANGNWGGIGFADATTGWKTPVAPTSSGAVRFVDSGIAGQPWMIHKGTGGQQAFAGPAGGTPLTGTGVAAAAVTMTVELDTTGEFWQASFFVNGTQYGTTHTYTTNPTINSVGLTANGSGSQDFSNFSVTAVPEPSAAFLGSLGVLALLRRRR